MGGLITKSSKGVISHTEPRTGSFSFTLQLELAASMLAEIIKIFLMP